MRPEPLKQTIALGEVLAAVEAGQGNTYIPYDTVQQWGMETITAFITQGLLKPASPLQSLECHGCEVRCYSDVVVRPLKAGAMKAYIVCEVPEKQAEMGKVPVRVERLQQWQCNSLMIAQLVARLLGLDAGTLSATNSQPIQLGMLPGPKGRRWVSLITAPLVLEVNQQRVPISDLLFIDNETIVLDEPRIQQILTMDAGSAGKQYQPNTDKRESGKLKSQAMYQEWRDEYERLRKDHPGKGKAWYAGKISKMNIARDRDAETIRKQLR